MPNRLQVRRVRGEHLFRKRYEVLTKIGAGGMADVYKGKDHMLNRYVAIKVLKKEFREDETFVKKFRSEAQAAAGLLNPNIVNVYDVRSVVHVPLQYHYTSEWRC